MAKERAVSDKTPVRSFRGSGPEPSPGTAQPLSAKLARVLPFALRQWKGLLVITVLTLLSAAMVALQPWPLKIVVDHALGDQPLPNALLTWFNALSLPTSPGVLIAVAAVASLLVFAANGLLGAALSWSWASTGQRMVYDLSAALFHRLQRFSLLYVHKRKVGDLLERLVWDPYCLQSLSNNLLIEPVRLLLTVVMLAWVAWQLDGTLTLLVLIVVPALGASAKFFGWRLKHRARRGREAESQLSSFVHQTFTAIPVVQAFGAAGRNRHQFEELASEAIMVSQQGTLVKNAYSLVNGAALSLGLAIVLFAGGQRVLAGSLTVGGLLVFLAYVKSIQSATKGLFSTYGSVRSAEAKLDRVLEVLDAEEQVREVPGARVLEVKVPGTGGHVRLEGVTFGYEPERPVLREVTLEARPGETVGLVGATGSGKSTLVSLIPRFFDPWEGRVLFDGVDVREVKLSSLRDQVALVLQEPFLLPLSVAENIAYGRPEAGREEIVAVAEAAQADEFIRALPEGYDTVIGERGATLSGGQRQRLAIARALLKDAPVLILDEPTSALDAQTEASLLEALDRLMEGRTTFVVAHRLSAIRRADRIVVLEHGRVVEEGSTDELLAARGRYHYLLELQATGGQEATA